MWSMDMAAKCHCNVWKLRAVFYSPLPGEYFHFDKCFLRRLPQPPPLILFWSISCISLLKGKEIHHFIDDDFGLPKSSKKTSPK